MTNHPKPYTHEPCIDSSSENLTSTTAETRDSVMSHYSDSPDVECFEALPADTFKAIGFSTRAIQRIIKQQKERPIEVVKYLRFRHVLPSVAEKVSLSSTRQMFNHDTRSLIVKLVTEAHQTASRGLLLLVMYAVRGMGLEISITAVGGKTIQGIFSSKEADQSFSLRQPVPGRDKKWPIITVEVGASDAYRKLKADAEWWLMNSRGDVKLVIIVSVNRKTPKIKFETVTLTPATLRLQRPRNVPTIRQSITTSRDPERPDATITVSPPVPLTIQFEELFCRQPVPPEHNIDLSPDQLREISRQVWAHQVF